MSLPHRFQGMSFTAEPGDYPTVVSPNTTSISLPAAGYIVVVYEFPYFQGRSLILTRNVTALRPPWTNAVFSYRFSTGRSCLTYQFCKVQAHPRA